MKTFLRSEEKLQGVIFFLVISREMFTGFATRNVLFFSFDFESRKLRFIIIQFLEDKIHRKNHLTLSERSALGVTK